MRRSHLLILTFTALAIIAASVIIPLRTAQAGEVTHSGFDCWMDDTYPNLVGVLPDDPFFTTNSQQRQSGSGNRVMICRFSGVTEDLAHAYTRMRFMCGVFGNVPQDENDPQIVYTSTQSKLVLTPNGDMLYICRLHHRDVPPPTAPSGPTTQADGASDAGSGSGFLPGVGPTDGVIVVGGGGDGGGNGAAPAGDTPSTDTDTAAAGGTTPASDAPTPTDPDAGGGGGNCGNDKDNGNGKNNGCGSKNP